jgi:hypothetical protein
VCEPDAVDPEELSLEYRPSGAISVINFLVADHPLATTLGVDHTALFDLFWDEFTAALTHDFLSV